MSPFFQVECPNCHAANKSGSKFCGKCGDRLPGSELKCSNCGAVVPADKKFCGHCGKPLSESAAPLMRGNRWARRADDFATKVEVDDVEGFFKRGLIVEAGTKAIFFVNGAYSGIVEPGRYDMGGLLRKVANLLNYKTTTAVLIDAGDVELQFSVAGLATRDPIRLTAECRLVVQLDNPTMFFENLMKGRQNYSLTEIKEFLSAELQNCLAEFVGSRSVNELSTNLALKQQMEEGVTQHLAKTFDRKGLSFVQVRIFNFRHPRVDAITNKMEEYWLHAEDLKVRLAGQDSTMGLERKLLDQETAEALMQLEVYEDRAKVYERMRKAVASDQMNRVTNENELEKFLQGVDKDKLLRASEMEDLVKDFQEKKEDHDLARRHLIQRLKTEQDIDLARAELLGKISLERTVSDAVRDEEMTRLDQELVKRRKEIESRQALEWSQLQHELQSQKAVKDQELEMGQKEIDVQLGMAEKMADAQIRVGRKSQEAELDMTRQSTQTEIELGKMKAGAEIDITKQQADAQLDIGVRQAEARLELGRKQKLTEVELQKLELELQREKDRADLETAALSLDILKKQKAIKKDEADWDVDRELRARAAISDVTLKEEAQRHQQELAKIQALSNLSAEALIAAAPADRAAMLTDLKRTETLRSFSEEQILAMAADKNPEVAKAFQEKFRNSSAGEVQKAYERMLAMKDQSTADLKDMSQNYARIMQEMFNRGMDTQRDTATATARAGQPGMTVITPGMPASGVIQTGAPAPHPQAPPPAPETKPRRVICPECGLETEVGQKFCDNCGHKFA
jgi:hypothetical protein